MPRNAKDWTGLRKGRMIGVERVGKQGCSPLWLIKCDCGTEKVVSSSYLAGASISCGCWRREREENGGTRLRHGKAAKRGRPRVYGIWNAMKQRTSNPNQPHYSRYGGLGVTVCERWKTFENFYEDMGDPPSAAHSLDRIDPFGHYEPGNCRWATRSEQARNTRRSKMKGAHHEPVLDLRLHQADRT